MSHEENVRIISDTLNMCENNEKLRQSIDEISMLSPNIKNLFMPLSACFVPRKQSLINHFLICPLVVH